MRATPRHAWLPLGVVAYALLVATYFVARTGGLLAETDTATQAEVIRSATASRTLQSGGGLVYANGFAYSSVSAALLAFTGLPVSTLQQTVYPLVVTLLSLPAWALFRTAGRSSRAATLATLLLLCQPEFLFVILRGSHERMLRLLMLVALWLLLRSLRQATRPAAFATHVALFYVATFGVVATNVYFGVSFLAAITGALALTRLASLTGWHSSSVHPDGNEAAAAPAVSDRLALIAMGVAALAFLVTFYAYPPASQALKLVDALTQRLAQLTLTTDSGTAGDPYVRVAGAWIHPLVYLVLASGDYVLMALSGVVWLGMGARWVLRRSRPRDDTVWLAWLLYGAFATQGALAIIADRTGVFGGNLQHRAFPSFAMVAVLLLATMLPSGRWPPWVTTGGAAVLAALAALALLKVTNEPLLSNTWTFYTPGELAAIQWADRHLDQEAVWVGPDERLRTAFEVAVGSSVAGNSLDIVDPKPGTRVYLVTDVMRLQTQRLQRRMPAAVLDNRIYDSGVAQLYRARPLTPYQR